MEKYNTKNPPPLIQSDGTQTIDVEYSIIEGSGGGGGGMKGGRNQRTPKEANDTLVSEDFARVIAVISEGEIEGFSVDQNQSIYLDDTPLVNSSGEANFSNYDIDYRLGTPSQTKLKGSFFRTNVRNIGTKIEYGSPVNVTITDPTVDSFIATIATPVFQSVNDKNGDINPTSVAFSFYVSSGGGPFILQNIPTGFNGKSSGEFSWDYQIALTGSAPWVVRVTRDTIDSTSQKLQNDIYLQRLTEVEYNPSTFDNRAVLYACFPAKYFNEIPTISAQMKGIKCPIPHNYNPINKTYSGLFNGTLTTGWTNNPAWILYDILTDTRYGMGIPAASIDVYSFYSLGQYCDEYISNGLGGFEPRYTFNAYITQKTEAYKLVESIASNCRAKLYLSNGSIVVVPDKPKSVTRSYNRTNVIVTDDSPPFDYTTTPQEERYPVVNVTWFDPSNKYKSTTETVSDSVQLAKYGYNSVDVTAFGCTSRGQAIRYARWVIYTSCYSIKSVKFVVDQEGLNVAPGEVISINDELQNQTRLAGRLTGTSNTTTSITLDSAVNLVSGQTYTLYTEDISGNLLTTTFTASSTVTTSTLSGLFTLSAAPRINAAWSLVTAISATQWWVSSIVENSEDQTFTITAIQYNPNKYTDVETFSQANLSFSLFQGYGKALPPNNLTITEVLFNDLKNQKVNNKLQVVWAIPNTAVGVAGFEIGWKRYYDYNWNTAQTAFTSYEILNPEVLNYNVRIRTLSRGGNHSDYAYYNYYVQGLTALPSDITGMSLNSVPNSNNITINWNPIEDLDVKINGYVEVRFNASLTSTDWTNAARVALIPGNTTQAIVPKQSGTYFIKALDSSGNYSENATYLDTNLIDIRDLNIVQSFDVGATNFQDVLDYDVFNTDYSNPDTPARSLNWNSPLFGISGYPTLAEIWDLDNQRVNVTRSGNDLTLSSTDSFDDDVDIFNSSDLFNADGALTVRSLGYYAVPALFGTFDALNSEFVQNITYSISAISSYTTEKFNSEEIYNSGSSFNSTLANVTVTPQIRKLKFTGSTFELESDWVDCIPGELKAGFFVFRLKFQSFEDFGTTTLTDTIINSDMPDVVYFETGTTFPSPSTTVFSYDQPMYQDPLYVGISIRNANSGDYYQVISATKTAVSFVVRNSSGTIVSRDVDVIVRGIGKQFTI